MAAALARKKVTINALNAKMKKGEPITRPAAYDYCTAVIADRLGPAEKETVFMSPEECNRNEAGSSRPRKTA